MSATCTVCSKSFPLEPGQAKATCPYCYTDFKVRGSKLIEVDEDDLAPSTLPAAAGKKKSTQKAGAKKSAAQQPQRQAVPATLGFAEDDDTRRKKKKKKPSSESSRSSGSSRSSSSSSGGGGAKKKKKKTRTFEDEIADIAAQEPNSQRSFARFVVISTVVLLLGGGIAAYLILNDYFTRRSENPLLNEGGAAADNNDYDDNATAGGTSNDDASGPQIPTGPPMPVNQLINELHQEMAEPTVAGMKRVIRRVEAALTEQRLESRDRNQLGRIGVRAEQALQSLMAMSQAQIHIESLNRADSNERQAFDLYFAQQASLLAERDLSARDDDLAATRAQARTLREEIREYLRTVLSGE